MTEQHVPVEELAAYAAGDLDAAAAVTVEAHVLLCEECRSDVEAVRAASAALASIPPVTMPAEVAARVDAALAAEAGTPPVGDVLPMRRRRRPSLAGIAAVAAGIALVGGISVPLLRSEPTGGKSTSAADSAERAPAAPVEQTRRLASGLDYTRATVAATLAKALRGATVADRTSGGAAFSGGGPEPSPATAPGPVATPMSATRGGAVLAPLEVDAGRLAACVRELGDGAVPYVVDFARFSGKPAVVVAFVHVSSNGTVSNKLDVWVAGAGCGTVAGGDVLDYQRVDRPPA